MHYTIIPREAANYAVGSAEEYHSIWDVDVEGERDRHFSKGDFILSNCTAEQLAKLGYRSQQAMMLDTANKHGASVRWQKYLKKVSLAFPAASVVDEFGEVVVSDLRELPLRWWVYQAASETDDPIKWIIRAANDNLSAIALTETYHAETGKDATVETAEQTVRQGEAQIVMVEGNRAIIEFADMPENLRIGDAIVTITQMKAKVQEVAQEAA